LLRSPQGPHVVVELQLQGGPEPSVRDESKTLRGVGKTPESLERSLEGYPLEGVYDLLDQIELDNLHKNWVRRIGGIARNVRVLTRIPENYQNKCPQRSQYAIQSITEIDSNHKFWITPQPERESAENN